MADDPLILPPDEATTRTIKVGPFLGFTSSLTPTITVHCQECDQIRQALLAREEECLGLYQEIERLGGSVRHVPGPGRPGYEQVLRAAARSPILRACMISFERGEATWEAALAEAVCRLAEQNDKIIEAAVKQAMHSPHPFLMPRGPK